MISASQFWTPAKRAEFNAFRTSNRYTAHWLPPQFRRIPEARPQDPMITEGPHKGFVFHNAWPARTNYMRSCRKGGDKAAQRVLNHSGWYADNFESNLIYACAVQIRIPRRQARREGIESESCYSEGQPTRVRWVEATEASDWDQICISRRKCDIHDSLEDAIRGADRTAELAAEEAREYDAKDQAEQETIRLKEEIDEAKEVIDLCEKELEAMKACDHLFARGVLVERIQAEKAGITKLETRIAALANDFWLAVPQ